MSIKTPIYRGIAQSDLDMAGFNLLNFSGGGSANVVYLSKSVTSDAYGAIGYGATAPTGADVTSAVQAAINSVPAGGTLVWDVAVGLGAPILIPSNITIFAPGRRFGAILRAAANCPMFRLAGIATDATTSKQNTFGKLDPAHAGNTAYRLLDAAFFNNENISLIGGTWNGNKAQQTGYPFTAAYGFLSIFQCWGGRHIRMEGGLYLRPHSALPIEFMNCYDVTVRDVEFDGSPLSSVIGGNTSMAGIQLDGPVSRVRIYDFTCHSDDDGIGICPDTSSAAFINSGYAGGASVCVPGVNYCECGDITDVRVYNFKLSRGIENTACSGCVRILSNVHLADDIEFHGISGRASKYALIIGALSGCLIDGTGNLGRILFEDVSVEVDSPLAGGGFGIGYGVFDIQGGGPASNIVIRGRRRGTPPASAIPDVNVSNPAGMGAMTLQSLTLEGDYWDDGTGGNVAVPQINVQTTVNRIYARTRSSRSGTLNASPVLLTATGASVGTFDFQGDLDKATNIVKHVAGTLGSAIMRGTHRNASTGSPLDIASGLTVTNGWHPDLAFLATNTFKSGSGTLTNDNSWH